MDFKTVLMVGAAVAALAASPTFAAPRSAPIPASLVAASYADLLEPIPNAVELLQASDFERAARPVQLIQAQYEQRHHHHHHDSGWYRQNGYYWNGGSWVLGAAPHHHHHHDSGWYRQNGYQWNGSSWSLGSGLIARRAR
jgi:hypothetical protein